MSGEDIVVDKGLGDYLRAIWRRKWTVLLVGVLAVCVSVGLDSTKTKKYTAKAQVLLVVPGTNTATGTGTGNQKINVPTDIELMTTTQIRRLVRRELGAAPPVTIAEVGTTDVVAISSTAASPRRAALTANSYAANYLKATKDNYVNSLNAQIHQLNGQAYTLQSQIDRLNDQLTHVTGSAAASTESQLSNLLTQQENVKSQLDTLNDQVATASAGTIIVPAIPPAIPSSPKFKTDAAFALGIGLLVGIGLALFRDHLDDRIRSRADLEEAAPGMPVLGMIPEVFDWRDRKAPFLVELSQPRSPAAEAYRSLRTSVQFMSFDRPMKLLLVTSAVAADGKTTTAANLAAAMAEAGSRVVLVSCDLRKPRIHEFFGLPNESGLTKVLIGESELADELQSVPEVEHLTLLGSGPVPPNPSELLAGPRIRQVFAQLGSMFDIVVIDSSPLLPVTDGSILAGLVDAVLLVAASEVSTRRDITRSLEMLARVSANVVGSVLNRSAAGDSYVYYRYGYGYGRYGSRYGYGAPPDPAAPAAIPGAANGNGSGARKDATPG